MNLREKKVLTTAERNQLVSELGPLKIDTIEATYEMPKITKLTDTKGLCTSHFMVQDLFEWQYGNEIEALPADEWVPVGPYYTLSYKTQYGVTPESHKFRLTHGVYVLTENDLPVLTQEHKLFEGWQINGVLVSVGDTIKGNTELVAKWSDAPTYGVTLTIEGEGATFATDKESYEAGETVTITATIEEGYEVESVTATWAEGEIEVAENEGIYTFVMPAGDVEVVGKGEKNQL